MIKKIKLLMFEADHHYFYDKQAAELFDKIRRHDRVIPRWNTPEILSRLPTYPMHMGQVWPGNTHPNNIQKFMELSWPAQVEAKLLYLRSDFDADIGGMIQSDPSPFKADDLIMLLLLSAESQVVVPWEICKVVS